MSALTDLQTALLAQADLLTDTINKAECQAYIAEYINLRTAILALSSSKMSSYSIAGRSVTRADLQALREQAATVKAELAILISGDDSNLVAIGDLSGNPY